jgi:hypothetical protein
MVTRTSATRFQLTLSILVMVGTMPPQLVPRCLANSPFPVGPFVPRRPSFARAQRRGGRPAGKRAGSAQRGGAGGRRARSASDRPPRGLDRASAQKVR